MGYTDRYGRRRMPLPRSLATRREIAENKCEEARNWSEGRIRKKYGMPGKMCWNTAVYQGSKRLAGRFHQLRTGHCRTGQYLKRTKNADTAERGWCQYKTQMWRAPAQELHKMEAAAEDPVGGSTERDWKREESFQNPRPVSVRTMHPIDLRLLGYHEGGKQSGTASATAEAG